MGILPISNRFMLFQSNNQHLYDVSFGSNMNDESDDEYVPMTDECDDMTDE